MEPVSKISHHDIVASTLLTVAPVGEHPIDQSVDVDQINRLGDRASLTQALSVEDGASEPGIPFGHGKVPRRVEDQ